LPGSFGIGSRGELVELLSEDEAKGRKALEVVEQSALTGLLEAMGRVAVSVAEELDAFLVGTLSCLSPEGPDKPRGARAKDRAVLEDEQLGAGEVGEGSKGVLVDEDAPGCEGTRAISAG
jgi:hypothetical protein